MTDDNTTEVVHFASRDDILGFDDRTYEVIDVPEWGGASVRLRGLTGSERDAWEASMLHDDGRGRRTTNWVDARAKLIVRCIIDGDGRRIFSDRDVPAVGAKSSAALQRLFEAARRLSGLSEEDVNDLTKDSGSDPNASNGSG